MSTGARITMDTVDRVHRLEAELKHEREEAAERRNKMAKMADLMGRMESELEKLGTGVKSVELEQENHELRAALEEVLNLFIKSPLSEGFLPTALIRPTFFFMPV